MIKKLEILGIQLDNYTVREAMRRVEIYLSNTEMNTIGAISMEMLVQASGDDKLRESIESLDLAIVDEKEILKIAKVNTPQRMKETVEKQFFWEFMKRIIRNKKSVYLFGKTKQQLEQLEQFLKGNYSDINIAGTISLEESGQDVDGVINEINITAPDIIFSVLPTPEQEYFLLGNKGKLNVDIWYGLGDNYAVGRGVSYVAGLVKKLFHKGLLHSTISKYNREK